MIELDKVGFSRPVASGDHRILKGVGLTVRPGRIVALVGPNGSGKTTLARLMCAMELPSSGTVMVDGHDPASSEAERAAVRRLVGYVQQDPVDQIVSSVVGEEVAFGPRNIGLGSREVASRVAAALGAVGLPGFEKRDTGSLSGGEQQRLALAGVLAMSPGYIVFDEPTAQLDSALRPAFRDLVSRLASREGMGIVIVTHDPLEVAMADRVVVLESGEIAWEGDSEAFWRDPALSDRVLYPSSFSAALKRLLQHGFPYRDVRTPDRMLSLLHGDSVGPDARSAVARAVRSALDFESGAASAGERSLVLDDVAFSYDNGARALDSVSLRVGAGRIVLLAGASGSGKSTLACIASGLYVPDEGAAELAGLSVDPSACGIAFQRPEDQFYQATVFDELALAPRNRGLGDDEVEGAVLAAAARVGLSSDLLSCSPFELSGGEARRVGLACVLTMGVSACVLDEPTAGLDALGRHGLHRIARELADDGMPVLVISHDLDEWIPLADSVALMASGKIVWAGAPAALLRDDAPWARAGLPAPEACRLLEAAGREG